MSRISMWSGKKSLALAVGSVLAGWLTGGTHASDLTAWPPKAAKIITNITPGLVPKDGTVTIQPTCEGGAGGACNIQLQRNGQLTNAGTINVKKGADSSIIINGGYETATFNNLGVVNVASGATGIRTESGNFYFDNTGTITVGDGATGLEWGRGLVYLTGSGVINAASAKAAIGVNIKDKETTVYLSGTTINGAIAGAGTGLFRFEGNNVVNGDVSAFNQIFVQSTLPTKKQSNWKLNGLVTETAQISVEGEIVDFYASSGSDIRKVKPNALRTLRVQADKPVILGADLVGHLHILGQPRVKLLHSTHGHKVNVRNVTIDAESGRWAVKGWLLGSEKVTIETAGVNLLLSDVPGKVKEKEQTLFIAAAKKPADNVQPTTIITREPPIGKMATLTIQGAAHAQFGDDLTKATTVIDKVHVAAPSPKWKTRGWIDSGLLVASGAVNNLWVSDNAATSVGDTDPQGTLQVAGKTPLAVHTKGVGEIQNLHILDNATLNLRSNPVVKNVRVDAGAAHWQVTGYPTGVEKLQVQSDVARLHVSDGAIKIPPMAKMLSLVSKDPIILETERAVNSLHLHGAARLHFKGAATPHASVNNVLVEGDATHWQTVGWLKDTDVLLSDGEIAHLYVSDTARRGIGVANTFNTLRVITAQKKPLRLSSTPSPQGKITNLHIFGAAQLASTDPLDVDHVVVNGAANWRLAAELKGVQSVQVHRNTKVENAPAIATVALLGDGAEALSNAKTVTIRTSDNAPTISAPTAGLIDTVNIGEGAQFGAITNVSNINVSGKNWHSLGLVTNPRSINVTGNVATINTTSGSAPATLQLAFNQKADWQGFFDIKGSVDAIDLSATTDRPSLRYSPTASTNYANIKGNLQKSDTIVMEGRIHPPATLPAGFTSLAYRGMPFALTPDAKRLELLDIVAGTTIKTAKPGAQAPEQTINIPFTANMPGEFHLKTSSKNAYAIDFSNPQRPTTTFEINAGTLTSLKGSISKKDRLMVNAGTLAGSISTIDTLLINGSSWSSTARFSNLRQLTVTKSGVVDTLNITTHLLTGTAAMNDNSLTVESSQPLPVTVEGTLKQLNILSNGHLGDVKMHGGKVSIAHVDNNANWQLGRVTDAAMVDARSHDFHRVLVGKGLASPSANNKQLSLNTETTAVSVWAADIKTLELSHGAKLDKTTGNVHNLSITGKEWSVKQAIPLAGDNKRFASIHIGKEARVAGINGKGALPVALTTSAQTVQINNAGNINGDVHFTGPATVRFAQSGGVTNGNLYGINHGEFTGDSHFNGDFKSPVHCVLIKGKLTSIGTNALTLRQADSSHPTLAITGELTTNRLIRVDGGYEQDGDVHFRGDPTRQPVVMATTINIGAKGRLFIDGSHVNNGTVLMQSGSAMMRPVLLMAVNQQYEHYSATLSPDKKQMVVGATPIGAYVRSQAMAGGASPSAAKALAVAAGRKKQHQTDPLNAFTMKYDTSKYSAAQLAKHLLPDNTGSVVSVAQIIQRLSSDAITGRISNGEAIGDENFWARYTHNDVTKDENNGVFGYSAKTNGFTLGVDGNRNGITAGLAYTYAKADISGNSSVDSKHHNFNLYGAYSKKVMFVGGRLSYGVGDNDARRTVVNQHISASYDNKSWGASLSGGLNLPVNSQWRVQPLAIVNYYRIAMDDYAEKAANPASGFLAFDKVSSNHYTGAELGAGLKLAGELQGKVEWRPRVQLMAFHDFKDDPLTLQAHFAGGGERFVVYGGKREQNRYQATAALDISLQTNTNLSLSYSYDWAHGFKVKAGAAHLRYYF